MTVVSAGGRTVLAAARDGIDLTIFAVGSARVEHARLCSRGRKALTQPSGTSR